MGSKEEQLIKNVKNLPDELIYIIKGFVGSYYPFIEELKNVKHKLTHRNYNLSKYNRLVSYLKWLSAKPEWTPAGYSDLNIRRNKRAKEILTELLKINKVKGRTKLIKEKNINNMINALIKI